MNDLSGRKFGYLKAIRPIGKDKRRNVIWECECICGELHNVVGYKLLNGNTKSCGCMTGKIISANQTVHGEAKKGNHSRLYTVWMNMRRRCCDPNVHNYMSYGGRGINVCEEWNNFSVFRKWALDNGYRDNLEIDRVDVNGNYEPSNCRFVTDLQQARNKRTCIYREVDGEKLCLSEIAEKEKLDYNGYKRLVYKSHRAEKSVNKVLGKEESILL